MGVVGQTGATGGAPGWQERALGSAAYFCSLTGLWFFGPLAIYFWKGRASRFVGFHALQSMLLTFAMLLVMLILGLGAVLLVNALHGTPLAWSLFYALSALCILLPLSVQLWLGIRVVLGRPVVLPLVGRWAQEIIAPSRRN
jgi:uncharacterized membrane protein